MSKIIFITGTSTGFGKLMTNTFSEAGHTVIATMRDMTGKNADVAMELAVLPGVQVLELDVTSDSDVDTAVANVLEQHGRIDVLINNAGIYGVGIQEAFSVAKVHQIMDVNFYGVLRLYQAILPSMRKAQDGLIINISSGYGLVSFPFVVPYCASKFALEALTEGSYAELLTQGIENVLIEPGAYPTELFNKSQFFDRPDIAEAYGQQVTDFMVVAGKALEDAMTRTGANPQTVADAALTLTNMEKGKRPLRTPLDMAADGVDQEYVTAKEQIKTKWLAKYGF
ncbi:SDR family oxidoreductase [Dyadobacter arcticus]|uniref:NAD(P)-dependent dehydrogenase (Short-subunit alcohol dehydrogenase family) n=1 Tax=Dyadobacter arcticus TaxID=1078754 RepID=A0ABX0UIT0_9BACT|nr:SDR family oxidoreductase [Dyadobacter arcticus]NIJ52907.1 NAD(P)-dependent dehydrogenase (short-subunit alcohol dehydrogenase family) [Dyadobacter arcticus]